MTMPNTARRGDVLERSMRDVAHRRDRRDARRRAAPGAIAATTVTIMPSTYDQMNAVAGMTMLAGRDVEAERAEQRLEPDGEADARDEADGRRDEADEHRLEQHRAEHLALPGADGAQQRELAAALGDDDREGVEDDERADEQRDDAEDRAGTC